MAHLSSSYGNPLGIVAAGSDSSARIVRDRADHSRYEDHMQRSPIIPVDVSIPSVLVTKTGELEFDSINHIRLRTHSPIFSWIPNIIPTRSRITTKSVSHAAKSVCLLQFWQQVSEIDDLALRGSATGVHIGKGIILTNLHVVMWTPTEEVKALTSVRIFAIWRNDGDFRSVIWKDGVELNILNCTMPELKIIGGLFEESEIPAGMDIALLRATSLTKVPKKLASVDAELSSTCKLVAINQSISPATQTRLLAANEKNTIKQILAYRVRLLSQYLSVTEGTTSSRNRNEYTMRSHSLGGSSGGMILNERDQYVGVNIGGTMLASDRCVSDDRAVFTYWNAPSVSAYLRTRLLPLFNRAKPDEKVLYDSWLKATEIRPHRLVSPVADF